MGEEVSLEKKDYKKSSLGERPDFVHAVSYRTNQLETIHPLTTSAASALVLVKAMLNRGR